MSNSVLQEDRPIMKPVNYYGCVQCQKYHFEDTEPDIYNLHFMRQEKHGIKQLFETMDERRKRYEERFQGGCAVKTGRLEARRWSQ